MKPNYSGTTFLLTAFLCIVAQAVVSQDVIFTRSNQELPCKVREVGTEVIRYTLPDYPEDVMFAIEKDKVQKIVFANGKELVLFQDMTNPEHYADNRKHALKVDFLSPLTGNTTFWYENSLKPGTSIEVALGIIGLGIDPGDENPAGAFIKAGYKAIRSPDFYLRGMRYAHILKGGYVKPEIAMGFYAVDKSVDYVGYPYYTSKKERREVVTFAIHLNFGKQWVFDNQLLVDWFVGVGYGFDTERYGRYHFGWLSGASYLPLSGAAGLKVGLLF